MVCVVFFQINEDALYFILFLLLFYIHIVDTAHIKNFFLSIIFYYIPFMPQVSVSLFVFDNDSFSHLQSPNFLQEVLTLELCCSYDNRKEECSKKLTQFLLLDLRQ